jgi:hypothetical protein
MKRGSGRRRVSVPGLIGTLRLNWDRRRAMGRSLLRWWSCGYRNTGWRLGYRLRCPRRCGGLLLVRRLRRRLWGLRSWRSPAGNAPMRMGIPRPSATGHCQYNHCQANCQHHDFRCRLVSRLSQRLGRRDCCRRGCPGRCGFDDRFPLRGRSRYRCNPLRIWSLHDHSRRVMGHRGSRFFHSGHRQLNRCWRGRRLLEDPGIRRSICRLATLFAEPLARRQRRATMHAGGRSSNVFNDSRSDHRHSLAAAAAKTLTGDDFFSTLGAVSVCHISLPAFRTRRRK